MASSDTPSIFKKTTNLIRLFLYAQGETEVPPQFYLWAFLTTIAAAVGDRVFVRKLAGSPTYANRYTWLVGPAGCGKGTAIDACTPFVRSIPQVNLYEGALTGASMMKFLHKTKSRPGTNGKPIGSKMYLVMEELAMDMPGGKEGNTFIKYIVGNWNPKPGEFHKQTVTDGGYVLKDRCINWLAGTTKQWFKDCITFDDLKAGAGRRLVVVEGWIDPKIRITRTKLPPERDELMEHLMLRFQMLAELEGEITKTPAALAWEDWWYQTRAAFRDEDDIPRWRMEQDLMNQIAMALVLADGGAMVMKRRHLEQGLELAQYGQLGLERMKDYVRTVDSGLLAEVVSKVRDNPGMLWGELVKATGLMSNRLQPIVTTLMQSGRIYTFKGLDGKVRYSTTDVLKAHNVTSKFHHPKSPAPPVEED